MSLKKLLFTNQTLRQTVMKNTFWLFVGQVLGRVLRAVLVIYAARVLGAADWGVFSYAIGVVAFLTVFTDLGINGLLTKKTASLGADENAEYVRNQIISTSFVIKIILMLASLVVLFFFAPLFSNIKAAIPLFPIVALVLIFDNLREFGFSITRALERMEVEAWFFTLTNALIVAGGLFALSISPTPRALAYAYAIGTGIGMLATYIFLRRYFSKIFSAFSYNLIKPILTQAWPFAMLGVMGGLMINTDTILLGWFRTAQELGWYAAAQKPVQVLYTLPTLLATSMFPALARMAEKKDSIGVATTVNTAMRVVLVGALPIVILGIMLGAPLIGLIYGADYTAALPSWRILFATLLIIFPSMIFSNAIFAHDQQHVFIKTLIIGAVSNVVLDFIFIPLWGGPGSAAATVIAQILLNGYSWFQLRRINPYIVIPDLRQPLLATAIMTTAIVLLQLASVHFIVTGLVASALYLVVLFVTREPLIQTLWQKS